MKNPYQRFYPFVAVIIFLLFSTATAVIYVQQRTLFSPHAAFGIYNTPQLQNTPNYLNTPTYDGSGQSIHPDVIYIPAGWQGFNYWMVMTPYPNSNDIYENPSILVSQDGLNWSSRGLSPITPSFNTITSFQSDPDIILVNNVLYVYYRKNDCKSAHNDCTTTLYRVSSLDGQTWSAPVVTTIAEFKSGVMASPAVIFQNGTYYLFYVDTVAQKVHRTQSIDGITWDSTKDVVVSLDLPYAWHLNVIAYQNHYLMLIADNKIKSQLFYFYSDDMLTWTRGSLNNGLVLSPSVSGWDSTNIYRSAFVIDGTRFRVWYSALKDKVPHIGYIEDPNWSYQTTATPACASWTESYINSCNSYSDYASNSSKCFTANTSVTVHITGSNTPTQMKFYNMPDVNRYCTSLYGNEPQWSTPEPYNSTKVWTLPSGAGDKKVCIKLKNSLGWSMECGGIIHYRP